MFASYESSFLYEGVSPQDLIDKCKKNYGSSILKMDEGKGEIRLKRGISWLSWGERINIKIEQDAGNSTLVHIKSKCLFQLLDFGVNRKNVLAIAKLFGRGIVIT